MLQAIGAPELMTEEGCLAIYETEAEFAADRGHLAMMQRYGLDFEVLINGAIQYYEPTLSSSIRLPSSRRTTAVPSPLRSIFRTVPETKVVPAA
ncbi:amino acid dehydrogenase, partial [Rhizobium johnstonii]